MNGKEYLKEYLKDHTLEETLEMIHTSISSNFQCLKTEYISKIKHELEFLRCRINDLQDQFNNAMNFLNEEIKK